MSAPQRFLRRLTSAAVVDLVIALWHVNCAVMVVAMLDRWARTGRPPQAFETFGALAVPLFAFHFAAGGPILIWWMVRLARDDRLPGWAKWALGLGTAFLVLPGTVYHVIGIRRARFSLRTLVIFMLLVTSTLGLWRQWRPWRSGPPPADEAYEEITSCHSRRLEAFVRSADALAYQGLGGRMRWVFLASADEVSAFVEGIELVPQPPCACVHVEAMRFRRGREEIVITFCDHSIVAYCLTPGGPVELTFAMPEELWRKIRRIPRGRPWGALRRWGFWLTVIFGGLLAWSIVSDRRSLGRHGGDWGGGIGEKMV